MSLANCTSIIHITWLPNHYRLQSASSTPTLICVIILATCRSLHYEYHQISEDDFGVNNETFAIWAFANTAQRSHEANRLSGSRPRHQPSISMSASNSRT
ncbi:hypothetical protein PSPO01_14101 [Paraphaeosphaeria sporulosa]